MKKIILSLYQKPFLCHTHVFFLQALKANLRHFSRTCGGGGIFVSLILGFLVFSQDLMGQSCSPFEFEITPIAPNLTSGNFSNTKPDAFHAFYVVKLKAVSGNLPAQWTGSYLSFGGNLFTNQWPTSPAFLNGFTSRINKTLTDQVNMSNPFYSSDILTNPETGTFSWSRGITTGDPCTNTNEVTLNLPNLLKTVTLFTLVVDAVPGETITMSANGTMQSCSCSGNVPVVSTQFSKPFSVAFGSCVTCAPTTLKFTPQFNPLLGSIIAVELVNPPVGNTCKELDGVLHILPTMNSINNISFNGVSSSFANFEFKSKTNTDGSTDIYFKLASAFPPTNPLLFFIDIQGFYNCSQGGSLNCSLLSSRVKWGGSSTTVCSPAASFTQNPIILPGLSSSCGMPTLTLGQVASNSCDMAIEYKFKTQTPISFGNLSLELILDPNSNSNTLGSISNSSNLNGGTVSMSNNNFRYILNTGPITVSDGDFIRFPLNLKSDCIAFYVKKAEGTLSGQTSPCALPVSYDLTHWPACNPEIPGTVRLSDGHTAPQIPIINLLSSDPSFNQTNTVNCPEPYDAANPTLNNASYSFCPDPAGEPFKIQLPNKTSGNWLYGIDAYDLVKLQRHILNVEQFTSPYQFVASNVIGASNGGYVATSDLVEVRKLILGLIPQFNASMGYPSWRYIKQNYPFIANNPIFAHPYTGAIDPLIGDPGYISVIPSIQAAGIANISNVPSSHQGTFGDFIAVKLGDVNMSGNCGTIPGGFAAENEARSVSLISIKADLNNLKNNEVTFTFNKGNTAPWITAQTGIRFDPNLLRLKQIIPKATSGVDKYCFGDSQKSEGMLRFLWFSQDGETELTQKCDLFQLVFEVLNPRNFDENKLPIWLSDEVLEGIAYQLDETAYRLQATYSTSKSVDNAAQFRILMQPNPAGDATNLLIFSNENADFTFQVVNSQGRICINKTIQIEEGENNIELNTRDLANGLYHLTGIRADASLVNYTFSVVH